MANSLNIYYKDLYTFTDNEGNSMTVEVDDDYIQSELDTVAETFTEDYETYYAE